MKTAQIYSIGYGNRKIDSFIQILKNYGIKRLIDIRSNPASRFQPSYSRKRIAELLRGEGIGYEFMGLELGGKPKDENLYLHGVLDYGLVNTSPIYRDGISKLKIGLAEGLNVCIMCCELDPDNCHRKTLVAETLLRLGINTCHIDRRGEIALHSSDFDHTYIF